MKIAIIGAGIGGLTTALLLSNKGHQVTIFEKGEKLGGRLSFVEEGEFRIDQGPTIVLLPQMIETILSEAHLDTTKIDLHRCDPLYRIHFNDGTYYTKYKDIQIQLAELENKFPGDVEGFKRFMKDMKIRFELGKPNFLEKSFLTTKSFWNSRTLQLLTKLKAYRSVYKQLQSYFSNEKLQIAYALQTLYVGGNPFSTPAIYSLVSFSEHEHGIYYLKGGYASLVETLEKELIARGVEIHKHTRVEKVVTDGNRAEALIVNGERYDFDSVVINGDFPVAGTELLSRKKEFTPSSACLLLYFGLDHHYKDALMHQFFMGDHFKRSMREIFDEKKIPTSPSYYTFYPSAVDDSLAPVGKSVLYTLVPVPSGEHIDWDEEGPRLAELIINEMEKQGFPELRKHVVWKKMRTPKMAQNEGLYLGGSFGIAPELFQSAVFRPQLKPFREENIFAVGASTHPGGGVPIVMQGAKLVSDYITQTDIHSTGKEVMVSGPTR